MNVDYGRFAHPNGLRSAEGIGVLDDAMLLMETETEEQKKALSIFVPHQRFIPCLTFYPPDNIGIYLWFCAVANWMNEKGSGKLWSCDCHFNEKTFHYAMEVYFENVTDAVMLKMTIENQAIFDEPPEAAFENIPDFGDLLDGVEPLIDDLPDEY